MAWQQERLQPRSRASAASEALARVAKVSSLVTGWRVLKASEGEVVAASVLERRGDVRPLLKPGKRPRPPACSSRRKNKAQKLSLLWERASDCLSVLSKPRHCAPVSHWGGAVASHRSAGITPALFLRVGKTETRSWLRHGALPASASAVSGLPFLLYLRGGRSSLRTRVAAAVGAPARDGDRHGDARVASPPPKPVREGYKWLVRRRPLCSQQHVWLLPNPWVPSCNPADGAGRARRGGRAPFFRRLLQQLFMPVGCLLVFACSSFFPSPWLMLRGSFLVTSVLLLPLAADFLGLLAVFQPARNFIWSL